MLIQAIRDNDLTPEKPLEWIDSPLFHWQTGDGESYVIGGVSGLNPLAPKADGKPRLHMSNTKGATFEDMIDLFRKLTGREPTAEEIEEARREWDNQKS
jgi:hypothetical protein